jgi:rubrerythrin
MKRLIVPVLAATLFLGASPAPFKVRVALERAVINEREAVALYDAFAVRATEEGYLGAASLFRAAARAERVHLARFTEALQSRGVPLPAESEQHPTVGTTAENLRAATAAEQAERDGTYRDAIAAAEENGDEEMRKLFDQTRDTEVEHANLFIAAGRQLESMKQPKTYYVCDHCGYTTDIEFPLCALCRDRDHQHSVE